MMPDRNKLEHEKAMKMQHAKETILYYAQKSPPTRDHVAEERARRASMPRYYTGKP